MEKGTRTMTEQDKQRIEEAALNYVLRHESYSSSIEAIEQEAFKNGSTYEHNYLTTQVVEAERKWISCNDELPTVLDVRIKLTDNSEMNVWTQSDGDYWSELLKAFITPDKVTHWKPNE